MLVDLSEFSWLRAAFGIVLLYVGLACGLSYNAGCFTAVNKSPQTTVLVLCSMLYVYKSIQWPVWLHHSGLHNRLHVHWWRRCLLFKTIHGTRLTVSLNNWYMSMELNANCINICTSLSSLNTKGNLFFPHERSLIFISQILVSLFVTVYTME